MNRTALSVIALAVGSVLIIALFNVYKPAVGHLSHDVFDKVHIGRMADSSGTNQDPSKVPSNQPKAIKPWNQGSFLNSANTENERAFNWWHSQQNQPNYDACDMMVGGPNSAFNRYYKYDNTLWNMGDNYKKCSSSATPDVLDFTKPYKEPNNDVVFYAFNDTETPKQNGAQQVNITSNSSTYDNNTHLAIK